MQTGKESSRLKNSTRNTIFGFVFKAVNIIGAFLSRTLLIYTLGVEYVGLDGLFTSVLTFLSMAELGFNSAIVYKLYKPISENNEEEICALINFYKRIYRVIGIIVLVIGLCILPFLGYFVKGEVPDDINIYSLFLIYLLNCCLTYWLFAYKTAILSANQREDLPNKVNCCSTIIKYILQITLLLCFSNYYLYAVIIPLTTILTNVGNALMAKKYFPRYICEGDISRESKKEITSKIKALFCNKIGVAIITGSDNIVISSFLGLTILGIYDSYYYIFSMIYSIFAIVHSAITPSVGNSIVKESVEDNYNLFKRIVFINNWGVTFVAVSTFCLYKPFIQLWIGEQNSFDDLFSLIMASYLYSWLYRFGVLIFKNAQGLWWQDRFRALTEAVVNLTLNLIFVRFIGIYGIMLSTLISSVIVSVPWESKVLFSEYFHSTPSSYFKGFLKNALYAILIAGITFSMCRMVPQESKVVCFAIQILICIILPNTLLFILNRNCPEFKFFVELLHNKINK